MCHLARRKWLCVKSLARKIHIKCWFYFASAGPLSCLLKSKLTNYKKKFGQKQFLWALHAYFQHVFISFNKIFR